MVEFEGETKREADDRVRELVSALKKQGSAPEMRHYDDEEAEAKSWEVRESALGATAFAPVGRSMSALGGCRHNKFAVLGEYGSAR